MHISEYINDKTLNDLLDEDHYYANYDWVVLAPTINELKIRAGIYIDPLARRNNTESRRVRELLINKSYFYKDIKSEPITINKNFWPHSEVLPKFGILTYMSISLTDEFIEKRKENPSLTQNKFLQEKILNHPKAPNLTEIRASIRKPRDMGYLTDTSVSGLLTLDTLKFLTANPSILASKCHIAVQPTVQLIRSFNKITQHGTMITDGQLIKRLANKLGFKHRYKINFDTKVWSPLYIKNPSIVFYVSKRAHQSYNEQIGPKKFIKSILLDGLHQNSIPQIVKKMEQTTQTTQTMQINQ